MVRFNYATGFLVCNNERYSLDELRAYLLIHARSLCVEYFIGTFFRPGVAVNDYKIEIDGTDFIRREINFAGQFVNTYDWDAIFFRASKTNLIQNFINEIIRHRKSCDETATKKEIS